MSAVLPAPERTPSVPLSVLTAPDDLLADGDPNEPVPYVLTELAWTRCPATVRLTNQQLAVMLGLAHGETVRKTASRLVLGEDTVKTHRRHAYQRLGVNDGAHAVALCMALGLITREQVLGGGQP